VSPGPLSEPTTEELVATVRADIECRSWGCDHRPGKAALVTLAARLEAAERTIEQREIGYREQIERAEAAETEWDLWRQDYNAQVDRAKAAEREVERLREALRGIIEEFQCGTPGEYEEDDPVVIIARAALAEEK
jgi:hypothetical protein